MDSDDDLVAHLLEIIPDDALAELLETVSDGDMINVADLVDLVEDMSQSDETPPHTRIHQRRPNSPIQMPSLLLQSGTTKKKGKKSNKNKKKQSNKPNHSKRSRRRH